MAKKRFNILGRQLGRRSYLDELLLANDPRQTLKISWERDLFGGKNNSEHY